MLAQLLELSRARKIEWRGDEQQNWYKSEYHGREIRYRVDNPSNYPMLKVEDAQGEMVKYPVGYNTRETRALDKLVKEIADEVWAARWQEVAECFAPQLRLLDSEQTA